MPGAKTFACPRCDGTDNIVTRHSNRGAVVVRERFCRWCRRRFYTQAQRDRAEKSCANPFAARLSADGRQT